MSAKVWEETLRCQRHGRVYRKGQTITLHSGSGVDTTTDLYWGAGGSAVWNNSGDTVKVLDPRGFVVEIFAY